MIGRRTRIASSAPAASRSRSVVGQVRRCNRRRLAVVRSLDGRRVELDEDGGAALNLARVAPCLLTRRVDPRVQLGEALGCVAVPRVPRVPPVDVRQGEAEHARADRAGHQRHPPSRLGQQHRVVHAPVAALERHALAREQAPDDLERLREPRHATLDRQPEDRVLDLDRAGAEPEHEAPARDLVDGRGHLRDEPGRMEARARDERAEPDAFRDGCEPGEHRPCLPRAALLAPVAAVEEVVAEPDRLEADLLGRPCHRHVLGPAHVALDLRQLDADSHRDFVSRSE